MVFLLPKNVNEHMFTFALFYFIILLGGLNGVTRKVKYSCR